MTAANIFLNVNSVEVIYNHVILVLKGVSFNVPEGSIVALLGGNGAGKTTTLRAVSNLLHGERGEVTKGSIELKGERVEALTPGRPGEARRRSGDGGAALFRPPDHRGEPDDRRLHPNRRQGRRRGDAGKGLRLFSAPSRRGAPARLPTPRAASSRCARSVAR
jgi:ABC-type dipeptide/oligopeptide/nickel transport system ATPase component